MKIRLALGTQLIFAGMAMLIPASSVWAQAAAVEIVPGAEYEPRSWLHEALLGSQYRDLWTTPITVPVLDLSTFAGGLRPVRTGGNLQTLALRFEAADGREYNFRSVNKELTPAMPEFTRETFVDWVRQDQTSAQLPTAPVVATPLLDAVGIPNPGPQLVMMPDDSRLGEFREQYAGMLGTIELHPNEGPENEPLFHGALRVAGTERLLEHLYEDPDDRVDARAFLSARLMDVFLGDFDRHEGQWRWARYDREGWRWWVPVPEDRDYAFVDYDGVLLELARRGGLIRLVRFTEQYGNMMAMVDNSLDLSRRLLSELPREVWDSTAAVLESQLTDEVIRDAVRQMPPEHFDLAGTRLTEILLSRRDRLSEAAADLYRILNHTVDVHGTKMGDFVEVQRLDAQRLRVRVFPGNHPEPRFDREFLARETEEVRVYLHEGNDHALVSGVGGEIALRIVGGGGDDRLEDLSDGPTSLYDARGRNTFVRGRRTSVDEEPWRLGQHVVLQSDDEGEEETTRMAPGIGDFLPALSRDWGRDFTIFSPSVDWRSDAELVIGGGPRWTQYGFRRQPYTWRLGFDLHYAALHNREALQGWVDFRPENSATGLEIRALRSRIGAAFFRGFGSDSPRVAPARARVWLHRLAARSTLHARPTPTMELRVGLRAERIRTDAPFGSPAAHLQPFGLQPLTRVGAVGSGHIDTRDSEIFPRRGWRVDVAGSGYPALLALNDASARVDVNASTYFALPFPAQPVFAVRLGGASAFGAYPFYDAAIIGGAETLRGYRFARFSGDRTFYGTTELRLPLTTANIIARGTVGVSAFADAGWVHHHETSSGWHTGAGASAWFALPVAALNFSYARGEEDRFYVHLRMPF